MPRPETWLSGRQQSQRSVGLDADVEGGADRAPEEVAVGEADRVRGAGAAAGEDAGADLVHVVLAEQRHVGLGLGQLAGVVEVDDRLLGGDDRRPLGRGQARAQRQQHGADLHQRVGEHDLLAARVHGQGGDRAAADAVGGEAAGDPGRLGLQLGVGHLGAVRDQRGAVGATLRSLGQPVVELHRTDIVPIMPKRHKDALPEQELYAPIEWETRRRVRGHPLREGRRDRQGHDRPARGAQRLPAADAGRGRRRPWSWPARTPRSA